MCLNHPIPPRVQCSTATLHISTASLGRLKTNFKKCFISQIIVLTIQKKLVIPIGFNTYTIISYYIFLPWNKQQVHNLPTCTTWREEVKWPDATVHGHQKSKIKEENPKVPAAWISLQIQPCRCTSGCRVCFLVLAQTIQPTQSHLRHLKIQCLHQINYSLALTHDFILISPLYELFLKFSK